MCWKGTQEEEREAEERAVFTVVEQSGEARLRAPSLIRGAAKPEGASGRTHITLQSFFSTL
jgi:hypothetical protein